jgi:hypothetical protein
MFDIQDRQGCITKAVMRTYFERSINDTKVLREKVDLAAVTASGEFERYADAGTDNLWIGFALGMRAAERIEQARKERKRGAW